MTTSNIDAYDTPVVRGEADAAAVRPRQSLKVRSLTLEADPLFRSVRPLVQAATDQDAKAASSRISPTVDWNTVRMIDRLAAHLIGQRYE